MGRKTPPSRRTYPRDIFILGLSDHCNERGPGTWSAEPPSWQISAPKPAGRAGLRGTRGNGQRAGHARPRVIGSPARLRGHTAPSNWKQHLSAGPRHAADQHSPFTRMKKSRSGNYPANRQLLLAARCWPDALIIYSRRVWIWNIPAGLTPPRWALARAQSWSGSSWPDPESELRDGLGWL